MDSDACLTEPCSVGLQRPTGERNDVYDVPSPPLATRKIESDLFGAPHTEGAEHVNDGERSFDTQAALPILYSTVRLQMSANTSAALAQLYLASTSARAAAPSAFASGR